MIFSCDLSALYSFYEWSGSDMEQLPQFFFEVAIILV